MYADKMNDLFFRAYIGCALWASTDDDGTPLDDNYRTDDIDVETLSALRAEAVQWFTDNIDTINAAPDYCYEQAGHDFWLTRNGHGAGFWDRGLGAIGDKLTAAATEAGPVDLYVGDNGLLYSYGLEEVAA